MRMLLSILALLAAAPMFATEPGTPMDCSDLELAPGLTCTEFTEPGEGGLLPGSWNALLLRSRFAVADNEGRILANGVGDLAEVIGDCGSRALTRQALVLIVGPGASRTPLVSVRERCVDASFDPIESVQADHLIFDGVRGRLFVAMTSSCSFSFGNFGCQPFNQWIARIDGFTPLADVLPPAPPPLPLCANGLDDDADGRVDAADPHCKSDADNDESRP